MASEAVKRVHTKEVRGNQKLSKNPDKVPNLKSSVSSMSAATLLGPDLVFFAYRLQYRTWVKCINITDV